MRRLTSYKEVKKMNMDMTDKQTRHAFEHVVKSRRAVRGFLPCQVPDDILRKVFSLAQRAPSNCNTQPWCVYVVSGVMCEKLKKILPQAMMEGRISLDFPYDGKYEGEYKIRQHDAAATLYGAMGIARDDKQQRDEVLFRNYSFFGAPHVAFIFLPEPFGIREAVDVGMYSQTLMLAMAACGIASCPQTSLSFQADIIREMLNIDKSKKLLFGISFGYEDSQNRVNRCSTGRATLEETTHFIK